MEEEDLQEFVADDTEAEAPEPDAGNESTESGEEQRDASADDEEQGVQESSSDDRSSAGLRKAMVAERKKRQAIEHELAEMRGQLSVYKQQPADPDAAVRQQEELEDSFYSNPTQFVSDKLREQQRVMRIEMSENLMRSRHEDYDQRQKEFIDIARGNQGLIAQMNAHPSPAQFAYDYATNAAAVGDAGSVAELRSKLESDLRQQIEEELKAKYALADAQNVSATSASARGAGDVSNNTPVGDFDFNAMLKGVNNQF